MEVERCCGTCRFWIPESTLEEILITKRTIWPHCRLDGKTRWPKEMLGCLGWKAAEQKELKQRGYEVA